jgi:hypothetical protein
MKQHEREYFIARIRSGLFTFNRGGLKLKVFAPKLEDDVEFHEGYIKAYSEAFEDGVMNEDEMLSWMEEKELWLPEDQDRIKGLQDDLEKLRIEIYTSRYREDGLIKEIRMGIRKGEDQLKDQIEKKAQFASNTCEGIAGIEKARLTIRKNTYLNNAPYDFESIDVDTVLSAYNTSFALEAQIRELVNNDPWKLIWYMKDVEGSKLFVNHERELTPDQKNVIIWSRMYDSVNESLEVPSEEVIKDHDMLDGWFLVQKKKREKERSDKEFEKDNEKFADSGEIFVVTKDKKNANRIREMNDVGAKMTIKDREDFMKSKGGSVQAGEFRDARLDKQNQSNDMLKSKFR